MAKKYKLSSEFADGIYQYTERLMTKLAKKGRWAQALSIVVMLKPRMMEMRVSSQFLVEEGESFTKYSPFQRKLKDTDRWVGLR